MLRPLESQGASSHCVGKAGAAAGIPSSLSRELRESVQGGKATGSKGEEWKLCLAAEFTATQGHEELEKGATGMVVTKHFQKQQGDKLLMAPREKAALLSSYPPHW